MLPDIDKISCRTDGALVYRTPCRTGCLTNGKPKQGFENIVSSGFEIFPNPSTDFITVSFSDDNFNTLKIVDNSGRVYIELAINEKDTEAKIDVSKLTTGVYYIMATDNNNIIRVKQFIKE